MLTPLAAGGKGVVSSAPPLLNAAQRQRRWCLRAPSRVRGPSSGGRLASGDDTCRANQRAHISIRVREPRCRRGLATAEMPRIVLDTDFRRSYGVCGRPCPSERFLVWGAAATSQNTLETAESCNSRLGTASRRPKRGASVSSPRPGRGFRLTPDPCVGPCCENPPRARGGTR
jgi:hypothetical protein